MLLTLAVIVRDDAQLLAGLLERHRPLYDEAVVIDTGSRDDSAATARGLGARVLEFPWCDDFAAARNAALAAARGRWILCLDADERIASRDLPALRARVRAASRRRCFMFGFRSYTNRAAHAEWQPVSGDYPEEEQGQGGFVGCVNVRLFPNREDLRFAGRVHESVEPAVRRLGLAVETVDTPIHHYGMARSDARMRAKDDLYGRLVRAKYADDPADSGAGLELACCLVAEGAVPEAVAMLETLAAREPADAHVLRARLYLAHARRRQGRPDEAESLLARLVTDCPGWAHAWVELARVLAGAGRWPELAQLLASAHGRHPGHPQLAQQEILLLTVAGCVPEAARLAAALAARHPAWPEAVALAERLNRSPLAGVGAARD